MKFLPIIALVAGIAVAGCASDPEPEATSTPTGAGTAASGPAPNSVEYFNQVVGDRVFFATDQHTLDATARATLQRQAQWLQANPGSNVTIEGHADERGTREYNLALGARRAEAARAYLVSLGVAAGRLRTISYGKERPEALCSAENCWSQNRRSVTVLAGAPTS